MNGYDSSKLIIKHGVPQGSVLGPLLFLIYINDLHKSIEHCTVRHFADDTNLLISSNSPKQLQSYLNLDLKNLYKWLRANNICLSASKTELLVFRHPNKKVNYEFKIKMNGNKLSPHNFSFYINSMSTRLPRAIGTLAKIRHYATFQ